MATLFSFLRQSSGRASDDLARCVTPGAADAASDNRPRLCLEIALGDVLGGRRALDDDADS
jgi:hypothetical protein